MNIFEQVEKSWVISKKDLSIYYLKGPVVIFGLLLPAFLFIAFVIGREIPVSFLIPSLLAMGLFFTSSAISPIIAPWETRMRTFERLISAPITLWAIILGDIIASFLFGIFISSFILLIGITLLGLNIINLYLIIGTLLSAFCFSSLGLLISAPPTDNPSNIMMLSNVIKFSLVFISGIFVPVGKMGSFKIISYFSPLTYYTDLVRYSVQNVSYFTPTIDLLVLLGFSILFFIIAIKFHERSLVKRF